MSSGLGNAWAKDAAERSEKINHNPKQCLSPTLSKTYYEWCWRWQGRNLALNVFWMGREAFQPTSKHNPICVGVLERVLAENPADTQVLTTFSRRKAGNSDKFCWKFSSEQGQVLTFSQLLPPFSDQCNRPQPGTSAPSCSSSFCSLGWQDRFKETAIWQLTDLALVKRTGHSQPRNAVVDAKDRYCVSQVIAYTWQSSQWPCMFDDQQCKYLEQQTHQLDTKAFLACCSTASMWDTGMTCRIFHLALMARFNRGKLNTKNKNLERWHPYSSSLHETTPAFCISYQRLCLLFFSLKSAPLPPLSALNWRKSSKCEMSANSCSQRARVSAFITPPCNTCAQWYIACYAGFCLSLTSIILPLLHNNLPLILWWRQCSN